MKHVDLTEVVRTLRQHAPPENIHKLLREHEGRAGHCDRCHTVSPCTIWTVAMAAKRPEVS